MAADARPAMLDLEGVSVDAVDAVWHEPDGRAGLTVVLAHGAGGDLHDDGLAALAEAVAASGHRAVRVNLPYRQRRAKGPPPRAERSVADWAAVRAAVAGRVDGLLVVGGKSYGGRVATMLAASGHADPDERTVGVVCCSYPLHPPGRPERLRVDHFGDVVVPVLFVQGTNDPFGSPAELGAHLDHLAGPATVVEVAGGNHSLHVPRTRSADGNTHPPPQVIAGLRVELATWLDPLAT